MAKAAYPMTRGVRWLQEKGVAFTPHLYSYKKEHGVARYAARALGVDEHAVVKTLVMETDAGKPLLVLMHGDCQVSTKRLARVLGVKSVRPCDVAKAQRVTGYQVGGISPFGTRRRLPVYIEASILEMERVYVNAGKRGFLVGLAPSELVRAVEAQPVRVAIAPAR